MARQSWFYNFFIIQHISSNQTSNRIPAAQIDWELWGSQYGCSLQWTGFTGPAFAHCNTKTWELGLFGSEWTCFTELNFYKTHKLWSPRSCVLLLLTSQIKILQSNTCKLKLTWLFRWHLFALVTITSVTTGCTGGKGWWQDDNSKLEKTQLPALPRVTRACPQGFENSRYFQSLEQWKATAWLHNSTAQLCPSSRDPSGFLACTRLGKQGMTQLPHLPKDKQQGENKTQELWALPWTCTKPPPSLGIASRRQAGSGKQAQAALGSALTLALNPGSTSQGQAERGKQAPAALGPALTLALNPTSILGPRDSFSPAGKQFYIFPVQAFFFFVCLVGFFPQCCRVLWSTTKDCGSVWGEAKLWGSQNPGTVFNSCSCVRHAQGRCRLEHW